MIFFGPGGYFLRNNMESKYDSGVKNGDRQEKSFERTSKNLLDHFFFAIDHLKVSALIFPQENIAKKCPG
jgi:hypothetical protein